MKLSELYDDPHIKTLLQKSEKEDEQKIANLTKMQRAVLLLICDGLANKNAAHELGISQRTLEDHRKAIMEKTGCKTFAELVRLVARTGN